jgi:hypothetical protein
MIGFCIGACSFGALFSKVPLLVPDKEGIVDDVWGWRGSEAGWTWAEKL